jgi:predicted deacylase
MTTRNTTKVALPNLGIGSENYIIFHRYGPQNCGHKVYIQASLHADELPGLLVAHHLINLLEVADKKGLIAREITIVPYANPIGLTQNFAGAHLGRFSAQSGTNFNRQFENVAEALIPRLEEKLHLTDQLENVRHVRAAVKEVLDSRYSTERDPHQVEEVLKYQLLREACDADIVLDLHCDSGMFPS